MGEGDENFLRMGKFKKLKISRLTEQRNKECVEIRQTYVCGREGGREREKERN